MEAGDEVIYKLGDGGVLAHDDEAGWHSYAGRLPKLVGLLVMAVERLQGCLQSCGKLQRIEVFALATALLGHVLADVFPQVAEYRQFVAGDVLGHGHARQLDDAALDGIHQRKIAHGPREQGTLGVA